MLCRERESFYRRKYNIKNDVKQHAYFISIQIFIFICFKEISWTNFDAILWLQWFLPLRISHSVFSFIIHFCFSFHCHSVLKRALHVKFIMFSSSSSLLTWVFVFLGDFPNQVHIFSFFLSPCQQVSEDHEPEEILRMALGSTS